MWMCATHLWVGGTCGWCTPTSPDRVSFSVCCSTMRHTVVENTTARLCQRRAYNMSTKAYLQDRKLCCRRRHSVAHSNGKLHRSTVPH